MEKFNARQFTKFGFVHMKDEDFNDDGTKFQIWMHEESGARVSYARYTFVNNRGEKVTEYFISPRESYYNHGLLYSDVCNEPEWENSDKFNGCFEVDMDELIELLIARHEMFLRVKAAVENEEIDMTEVNERAKHELDELNDLFSLVKENVAWWELDMWNLNDAARDIRRIIGDIERLNNILNGEPDSRKQRELIDRLKNYGYVINQLEKGSEYSFYNELMKLACK